MKYGFYFDGFLRRKLKEFKRTFRFNDQVLKALRSSQIKVPFNKAWVTYKFKNIVGENSEENFEVSQIIIILVEVICLRFYVVLTVLAPSIWFYTHILKKGNIEKLTRPECSPKKSITFIKRL